GVEVLGGDEEGHPPRGRGGRGALAAGERGKDEKKAQEERTLRHRSLVVLWMQEVRRVPGPGVAGRDEMRESRGELYRKAPGGTPREPRRCAGRGRKSRNARGLPGQAGRVKRKVAPHGPLSAQMHPPCALTIPLQIASPS